MLPTCALYVMFEWEEGPLICPYYVERGKSLGQPMYVFPVWSELYILLTTEEITTLCLQLKKVLLLNFTPKELYISFTRKKSPLHVCNSRKFFYWTLHPTNYAFSSQGRNHSSMSAIPSKLRNAFEPWIERLSIELGIQTINYAYKHNIRHLRIKWNI